MRLALLCLLATASHTVHATVPPPFDAAATTLIAGLDNRLLVATTSAPRGTPQNKSLAPGPAEKSANPSHTSPRVSRTNLPVGIATTTGPGQGGYVHFFIIETPGAGEEVQVGLELTDGRIAWSFPELGVVVSPFMSSGELEANGRVYTVQHQYGIRPFPDDGAMRALQKELMARVAFWVEDGTPYCNTPDRTDRLCMSCLGFVLRVLFPGRTPAYPALPRDFGQAGLDGYYSTDDLLLYLTGLESLKTPAARLKRIEGLALPRNLREDLKYLVDSMEASDRVAEAAKGGAPRNLNEKMRSGVRSYSRTPAQRKRL